MTAATPERDESVTVEGLRARLAYRRERLALAQALGRPAHIARCRDRVMALKLKISALERTQ